RREPSRSFGILRGGPDPLVREVVRSLTADPHDVVAFTEQPEAVPLERDRASRHLDLFAREVDLVPTDTFAEDFPRFLTRQAVADPERGRIAGSRETHARPTTAVASRYGPPAEFGRKSVLPLPQLPVSRAKSSGPLTPRIDPRKSRIWPERAMELTRSVTRPFSIRWPMRALIWICPPWGSSRPAVPDSRRTPFPASWTNSWNELSPGST